MENYDNIKTLVNQNLPDNSLQQITASKLREVLNNLIDTIDAFDSQETTDIADLKKKASDANTSLANLRTDLTTERNRNNSQDARLTDLEGADQQIRGSIADLKKDVDENYNFTRVFFNEYAPKVKKNAEDIAELLDKMDNYEGITDANAQQIEQLLTSISKLTSDINKMNDALSNTVTKAELRQVNEHLAGLDNTDEIHQREIDEIRDNYLGELNNRTNILEGSVEGLTNELNSLKEKVNTVETDLNDLKTNTNRKNAEQDTAINDLKAADQQIRGAIQHNEEMNAGAHNWFQVQIDQHYAEKNELERQFNDFRQDFWNTRPDIYRRLDEADAKNAEQDKKINELREDIDKNQNATNIGLQTQIDELKKQHEALDGDYSSFRDTVTTEQIQQNEKINKIDTELDNLAEAKNKKDAEHDKAIADLQNTDVRISDEMKKMGEILDYLQIKISECCAGGGSSDFFNGQGRLDFPLFTIGSNRLDPSLEVGLYTEEGIRIFKEVYGMTHLIVPVNLTLSSKNGDYGKALCINYGSSLAGLLPSGTLNYAPGYFTQTYSIVENNGRNFSQQEFDKTQEVVNANFLNYDPDYTYLNGDKLSTIDEVISYCKKYDVKISPCILHYDGFAQANKLIKYINDKCKSEGVEAYCLFTDVLGGLHYTYDIKDYWDNHLCYVDSLITDIVNLVDYKGEYKQDEFEDLLKSKLEKYNNVREKVGGKMMIGAFNYNNYFEINTANDTGNYFLQRAELVKKAILFFQENNFKFGIGSNPSFGRTDYYFTSIMVNPVLLEAFYYADIVWGYVGGRFNLRKNPKFIDTIEYDSSKEEKWTFERNSGYWYNLFKRKKRTDSSTTPVHTLIEDYTEKMTNEWDYYFNLRDIDPNSSGIVYIESEYKNNITLIAGGINLWDNTPPNNYTLQHDQITLVDVDGFEDISKERTGYIGAFYKTRKILTLQPLYGGFDYDGQKDSIYNFDENKPVKITIKIAYFD